MLGIAALLALYLFVWKPLTWARSVFPGGLPIEKVLVEQRASFFGPGCAFVAVRLQTDEFSIEQLRRPIGWSDEWTNDFAWSETPLPSRTRDNGVLDLLDQRGSRLQALFGLFGCSTFSESEGMRWSERNEGWDYRAYESMRSSGNRFTIYNGGREIILIDQSNHLAFWAYGDL